MAAGFLAVPAAHAEPEDWSFSIDDTVRHNAVYARTSVTVGGSVSFARESFEHGISHVDFDPFVAGSVPEGCPRPAFQTIHVDNLDYEDPDRVEDLRFDFTMNTPCNGRFSFEIVAYAGGPVVESGEADVSPALGATFDIINPPNSPRDVAASTEGGTVSLTWDGPSKPSPDFAGFVIERALPDVPADSSTTTTARAGTPPTTEAPTTTSSLPSPSSTTTSISTTTTTSSTTSTTVGPTTTLPAGPTSKSSGGAVGAKAQAAEGAGKASGFEVIGIVGKDVKKFADVPGEGTWQYRVRSARPAPGPNGEAHTVLSRPDGSVKLDVAAPPAPPPGEEPAGGDPGVPGGDAGGGASGGSSGGAPRQSTTRIPINPSAPLGEGDDVLFGFIETLPFDISELAADGSVGSGSLPVFFDDDGDRERELRETLIPVAGALILAVGAGQIRYLTSAARRIG